MPAPLFDRWSALMSEAEAAAYLSMSGEHLRQLRTRGHFPRRVIVPNRDGEPGKRRCYRIEDLDAWRLSLSYEGDEDEAPEDFADEWGESG
ncbi:MAG: hypothetical protein AAF580_15485 [Pseudomonadota bacterium]